MSGSAAELAHRLAREAEAVCRHYLSNGRRQGRYWLVGDVQKPRAAACCAAHRAGRRPGCRRQMDRRRDRPAWRSARPHPAQPRFRSPGRTLGEARAFLGLPKRELPRAPARAGSRTRLAGCSPFRARSRDPRPRPISPTRGITARLGPCQRSAFTPPASTGAHDAAPRETWPALIAAVTDPAGAITGVHRTWLDPGGAARRRSRHHGVRWAISSATRSASARRTTSWPRAKASRRCCRCERLPDMPLAAALSANHLAALILPPALRRLYIARDNDAAGRHAAMRLRDRARRPGSRRASSGR